MNLNRHSSKALDRKLTDLHHKVMNVSRLWGINIAVLEVVGLGGLLGIISAGAYYISLGLMQPE